jgi:energy-coupling factor transport system permease protein
LRIFRRLSFRSALTATLATRMLPVLAADSQRLAEAQRTRPGGAPGGARGKVALIGAVVGGSLDRAMDVAATLEVRGFAGPPPARLGARARADRAHVLRRPFSRHDLAFAASAVAVLALATAGRLAGVASFDAYPRIEMTLAPGTLVLCAALLAAVLLPFCDRRGIDP